MTEPIIDNPDDVDNPVDGNWYDGLAGDNVDRAEVLKAYESPDKFFEEFDGLKNKNWRDDFAGDDLKFKSTLERFKAPEDFGQAFREQRAKISSGELRPTPPAADADEKDIASYREANGIPLEAKQYLEGLPDGLVLGEDDMPIAETFMEALHSVHAPPEYAHALIERYNKFSEEQQEVQAGLDAEQHQATEDELRQAWSGDYRANINLVGSLLETTFGKEAKEQLLNGRFQDGRGFMNDPKILEGLAELARKINPVTQLTPPGGDPVRTLNEEISEIEKFMSEKRHLYNKDEKMQARLRDLYKIRLDHEAAA